MVALRFTTEYDQSKILFFFLFLAFLFDDYFIDYIGIQNWINRVPIIERNFHQIPFWWDKIQGMSDSKKIYCLSWYLISTYHMIPHSSEIRGLCLMKWTSKMCFRICNNWKNICGFSIFIYQKHGKFCSVLQVHFIKHKPLVSEEWYSYKL